MVVVASGTHGVEGHGGWGLQRLLLSTGWLGRLPPDAAALHAVRWPILQSSANRAGEPDARAVEDVPAGLREAVDLVLDAGPLPGTPSTVIDLRRFDTDGTWSIDIADATVVHDQDGADRLTALGAKAAAEQIVVGPYLVEVRADAAGIAPVSVRERIRAFGPTAPQIVAGHHLSS